MTVGRAAAQSSGSALSHADLMKENTLQLEMYKSTLTPSKVLDVWLMSQTSNMKPHVVRRLTAGAFRVPDGPEGPNAGQNYIFSSLMPLDTTLSLGLGIIRPGYLAGPVGNGAANAAPNSGISSVLADEQVSVLTGQLVDRKTKLGGIHLKGCQHLIREIEESGIYWESQAAAFFPGLSSPVNTALDVQLSAIGSNQLPPVEPPGAWCRPLVSRFATSNPLEKRGVVTAAFLLAFGTMVLLITRRRPR